MEYKIQIEKTGKGRFSNKYKVTINGLDVGQGTRDQCEALANELKGSEEKTKLVHDMFEKRQWYTDPERQKP
jgi:hypothetical protein